ncbi:aspartyl protease family protein [Paenibacillus sp. M-152]|uniref:aspartyl protease family protein n=1 Tax=Paenibacillus sp. M-152 TaxID=2487928 RepID=UPI000F6FED88|nr:aspartyl protease family protein [Paenibacillus sp. M-152]AZH30486.1 aspartyl protease [Paenibacillus sp. M-152]
MKIEYRDGLLFTEITVHFNGEKKVINNIVIDTGASHTLISQDEVDDIGIQVGDFILRDVLIDFTSFKYHNINGLLGLDILVKGKFNVDLENFKLSRS